MQTIRKVYLAVLRSQKRSKCLCNCATLRFTLKTPQHSLMHREKWTIFPNWDKCNFLVRSPKDGELLGLEWGMMPQVSNIIFPDQNSGVGCQYSKWLEKRWRLTWRKKGWKFFEFFVRPRVVVGKYLEIFHLGVGLLAFWKLTMKCRCLLLWR